MGPPAARRAGRAFAAVEGKKHEATDAMSQGMAVSNYKADDKEIARNKKKLMALVKQPGNITCADCPAKRKSLPLAPKI